MSYLEQQKKVAAENEERERRKIKDEEEQKISEAHVPLHIDNEQDENVNNLDFLFLKIK